jgi:hypothetical protein
VSAVRAVRASPPSTARTAWSAWKQAELDIQAEKLTAGELRQLAALSLGAFFMVVVVAFPAGRNSSVVSPPTIEKPKAGNASDPIQFGRATEQPGPSTPGSSATVSSQPPVVGLATGNGPVLTQSNSNPGPTPPEPGLSSSAPKTVGDAGAPVPPAQAPPKVLEPPKSSARAEPALLDLAQRADARRVQERLIYLGYLRGTADGIWGARSQAALREFRRQQGMGNNDRWDLATQQWLMSD